jgi:shikimate kinase
MEPSKVFLVGPMGSGKSTVARILGHCLGMDCLDLDDRVASLAGRSIPAIFEAEGEAGFRDWEERALAAVADRDEPLVVATGGGVVLREANRQRMRATGWMVYLETDVDTQLARTAGDSNRPLLQVADPRSRLAELQAERDPLYREAHRTVSTAHKGSRGVAKEIAAWLRAHAGFEIREPSCAR